MDNNFEPKYSKYLKKTGMRFFDRFSAKESFSKFFIGYVFLYLIAIAFTYTLLYISSISLVYVPEEKLEEATKALTLFITMMTYVGMYAIGLPVLYQLVKNIRTWEIRKEKLGFGFILVLFFIGQFVGIVGNIISTVINEIIYAILGLEQEEVVGSMINDFPIWFLAILTLVIAPIFEELIFRKLLMDRVGVYGEKLAIIVSGLAFGAFHGNIEQLLYTTMVGFIFAFAYAKTKKLCYSMLLHFLFNLFGGMLPAILSKYIYGPNGILLSTESYIATTILIITNYGFAFVGFILLIIGIIRGWFIIDNSPKTVYITQKRGSILFFNLGSIMFILLTIYQIVTTIIPLDSIIKAIVEAIY